MPALRHIDAQSVAGKVKWVDVLAALKSGHAQPKPQLKDQLLNNGDDLILSRAAWISGMGMGVKTVSVMAGNPAQGLPSVQGAMLVFEDQTGRVKAVIDNDVITYWKTAGDSVLGARLLARPDSETLLIIGAGIVAESLVHAYSAIFPELRNIQIWNRTQDNAQKLAGKFEASRVQVSVAVNLGAAVAQADIVSAATFSKTPIIRGEWVRPGTHIDLIGAFTPEMREADDDLMQKGCIFVDCRETTIEHIGEILIPIKSGAIWPSDILGDFYDIIPGHAGRRDNADITVFKNGGGAHLDLMVAHYLIGLVE